MPWGTTEFTLLYNWPARRDAGSPTNIIGADEMQAQQQDLADGLEACIRHNGDIAASANLPMGGFVHTNAGAATARTNYVRVTEFQDGGHVWIAGGGTADAITATYVPALTALTNGCHLRFRAASANATTTPTFAPNGLTAKTIVKGANAALVAGDIAGQHHECIVQYNSTTDAWHLLNPAFAVGATDLGSLTTDATGGDVADFLPFVDASESNASNKVTVQKFYDVSIASLTAAADGGATGDTLIVGDASASNAAKKVTADNFIANTLQLLTDDSTGGALTDYVAIMDASESNAGNRTRVDTFSANIIGGAMAWTTEALANYHILTRKTDGANLRSINLKTIGAGKQTIWIPAGAMISRTTNGPSSGTTESTTNKVMMKTLDFDQTTQEYAQFTVAFPKGWNEVTVTFQPLWTADAGSGTFITTLAGVALADDDAVDTAFGTAQSSTDTLIATGDVHVGPESSAITIAGSPSTDELVVFQVSRDVGTDTLTGDARLIGIKLFYTTDANTDD